MNGGPDERDRFLAIVAHELRSPLTLIRGWAEFLAEHQDLDAATRERALGAIVTQCDKLLRLAGDTLDASTVTLGHLPLLRRPTDLGELVKRVAASRPEQHQVDAAADLVLDVDPDRMTQVIDNLLDNARRYGTAPAALAVRREGDVVAIEVRTVGSPIEPHVAARLFAPFQRGQLAQGAGLGLYVCQSLIHAHGGEIGLRTDAGGNTFWITLPAA